MPFFDVIFIPMWSKYLLILAAAAAQVELGQTADLRYSNSSSCVDPSGMESCKDRAWDSREDCLRDCATEFNKCEIACDCLQAQDMINCAATSCWNDVYSCTYQETVGLLLNICTDVNDVDVDQIPFWPIPDNAPGGCVCDVAEIANKQRQIKLHIDECGSNVTYVNNLSVPEQEEYFRACECCTSSALISSIWDTCPNTDPDLNTAPHWNRTLFIPFHWDTCGPTLQKYDCAAHLWVSPDTAEIVDNFYKPDNVPKNGAGLLTNTGGTISTPVSGSTFTWTLGSSTYPITAAASNTAASTTTSQGPQETGGGESAASLRSRPSLFVAVAVAGFCLALIVC